MDLKKKIYAWNRDKIGRLAFLWLLSIFDEYNILGGLLLNREGK